MTLPLTIWILLAAAAICCAVGFYKYVYFISIGYGFAIAGCGIALLIMYPGALTWGTLAACILFIIYGCRLSGYLLYREMKSASYNRHMKGEIKSGDSMGVGVKIALWISCAILYVLMVSPVFYRLVNGEASLSRALPTSAKACKKRKTLAASATKGSFASCAARIIWAS